MFRWHCLEFCGVLCIFIEVILEYTLLYVLQSISQIYIFITQPFIAYTRGAIVDNHLASLYINGAIMPICDDPGIISGTVFTVGHFLAMPM